MSSHHIIREGQEPALIIANGESCSNELLGQLLEWSPFVVVLDGAINRVLELGIKIDVLLGDFDSKNHAVEQIQAQQKIEIVHTPDQNKTDLQKGIEFLIARNFDAVNIIWATGRRADHNLSNITDIVRYKQQINIVLHDDYSKIFQLPKRYQKWYVKDTVLSLMPVGVVSGVTTQGLSYNLQNDVLTLGYRTSSSNSAAQDGQVMIEHTEGDLLMMECRDI
ncbi:MAG: thiamine diphosphokinase [Bacteroidia bacterium]